MEGVIATNGKEKVMFEHKTEEEARKEILSMVEGYYRAFHAKKEDFRERRPHFVCCPGIRSG